MSLCVSPERHFMLMPGVEGMQEYDGWRMEIQAILTPIILQIHDVEEIYTVDYFLFERYLGV